MLTECKAGLFLNAKYMFCESHERFWQVKHKFQKHSFCMLLSKEFLKQAKFLGMWWSSEHALLQAYLMLVKFLLLSSNVSSYSFREKNVCQKHTLLWSHFNFEFFSYAWLFAKGLKADATGILGCNTKQISFWQTQVNASL